MVDYLHAPFDIKEDYSDSENGVALYFLLVGCILGLSIFVSLFLGRIIALLGLSAFLASVVDIERTAQGPTITIPIQAHPIVYYPTIILWITFLFGFLRDLSLRAVLHVGAFIVFSGVALFIVPAVIPRERAFKVISILGAASVLISLPAVIWGEIAVAGYTLSQTVAQRSVFGLNYWAPGSIYDSRNYFRVLVAFGTICAAALFAHQRHQWIGGIFFLNVLGVVLTEGRAAILAVLIAVVLVGTYIRAGPRALANVTLIGIAVTFIGFAIGFSILPGPSMAIQSLLGQRAYDWLAGYQAFLDRPVLGWGIIEASTVTDAYHPGEFTGIHTSYLRMFVISGIIGGISYLVLCGGTLWLTYHAIHKSARQRQLNRIRDHLLDTTSNQKQETVSLLALYCLLIMSFVFQLFDGATIFGANISSVLWAIIIGYGQSIYSRTSWPGAITLPTR